MYLALTGSACIVLIRYIVSAICFEWRVGISIVSLGFALKYRWDFGSQWQCTDSSRCGWSTFCIRDRSTSAYPTQMEEPIYHIVKNEGNSTSPPLYGIKHVAILSKKSYNHCVPSLECG
jgi:hypothetical protein